jgi:putative hemolysin
MAPMSLVVWLVLLLLLCVRGLFAAMDAALAAVSHAHLKELARGGSIRARRVSRLKSDPEATASALRTGMVLAGFLAAAIGVLVPPRLLDTSLSALIESSWLVWLTPLASALLVAMVATLIDVTCRSMAVQRPEPIALALSGLITMLVWVFSPLVKGLIAPVNLVLKPFGTRVSFQAPPPPLEELEKQLIRQAQVSELDKGAPALIRSIFELSDKRCRDVMVPRTEVVAIDVSTPLPVILQLIAEENHSRIPVFQGDIDHVIGILHVRDIVPMVQHPELILLNDLLRPVEYVPWVKPIGDLLRAMQKERIHMAVVVDEYGGLAGIVTLEDILREIVGDIGDEFEKDETSVERQADDTFLVDAMLPIEEFARAFDFKFPEGDFETLGGFLGSLAGALPEVNDRFSHNGWTFVVHAKDGPRLERVKVVKPRPSHPGADRRPSYDGLQAVKV